LLLCNCQAQALAACLEALHGRLEVNFRSLPTSPAEFERLFGEIDGFDRVLVSPQARELLAPGLAERSDVAVVPQVLFQGYHPDLCFLSLEGALAKGLLGPCHSAIAYAAWRAGYDLPATLALYRADVYAALGYHEAWASSRDQLLSAYRAHGLELETAFVRWSRAGVFMHSLNHPKIGVLMDLARELLRSAGEPILETGVVPPDFLVQGPVFPVYPEIGARLGVAGSYRFKAAGSFASYDLAQYVEASRAAFEAAGDAQPELPAFLPMIERAEALFSGAEAAPAPATFVALSPASDLVCDEEALEQVRP
jgi:hypothetical protein